MILIEPWSTWLNHPVIIWVTCPYDAGPRPQRGLRMRVGILAQQHHGQDRKSNLSSLQISVGLFWTMGNRDDEYDFLFKGERKRSHLDGLLTAKVSEEDG